MAMYLVTGAAGFIGFHLSLKLLKKNETVIGLDNINDYYGRKIKYDRLKILRKFKKFKFFKLDLNNNKILKNKIGKFKKKIEIIVHLAGQAGVRYSVKKPNVYAKSNLYGFTNILEMCRNFKIKHLVLASSSSVYGGNIKYG